jgi:hypothetical protein
LSAGKALRAIKVFLSGLAKGLILMVVYVIAIPWLLSYISTGLLRAGQPALPKLNIWCYIALLVLFVSLETAATINKRNVYGLLATALSRLIGLLFVIYALSGGVIQGSMEMDNTLVSIRLDIKPLLLLLIAYTSASIVLSSVDMSYEEY